MDKFINADILVNILQSKIAELTNLLNHADTDVDRLQIKSAIKGLVCAIDWLDTIPPANVNVVNDDSRHATIEQSLINACKEMSKTRNGIAYKETWDSFARSKKRA